MRDNKTEVTSILHRDGSVRSYPIAEYSWAVAGA